MPPALTTDRGHRQAVASCTDYPPWVVRSVCVAGYLVCFTRRIVEVQADPLRRSPSAVDLIPTPRFSSLPLKRFNAFACIIVLCTFCCCNDKFWCYKGHLQNEQNCAGRGVTLIWRGIFFSTRKLVKGHFSMQQWPHLPTSCTYVSSIVSVQGVQNSGFRLFDQIQIRIRIRIAFWRCTCCSNIYHLLMSFANYGRACMLSSHDPLPFIRLP